MIKRFVSLGLLAIAALCSAQLAAALPYTLIGPAERPALIQVAQASKQKKKRPLLLVLHGYNMDAGSMDAFVQASATAQALSAHLILPNGRKDLTGKGYWHATDACCNLFDVPETGLSDEDYLVSLVNEAIEKFEVDRQRIYVIGFSNGGFMANRLACNHSELFAGMASLAGATYADPLQCQPTRPISMLQIHGTLDPVIAYNGGYVKAFFPSAPQTTAFWAERNGCTEQTAVAQADELSLFKIDLSQVAQIPTSPAQLYPYLDLGPETDTLVYSGCRAGSKVGLWTMNGLGHAPYYKPDLLKKVIDFLDKHED